MTPLPVLFISVEDEDLDLVVSFALKPRAERSLTLLRTPEYEAILDESERGVSVSPGVGERGAMRELLLSVKWGNDVVELQSTEAKYLLAVATVGPDEKADALSVLQRMNFDARFQITEA